MSLNRQSGRVGAKSTHLGQIWLTHMVFVIQTFQRNWYFSHKNYWPIRASRLENNWFAGKIRSPRESGRVLTCTLQLHSGMFSSLNIMSLMHQPDAPMITQTCYNNLAHHIATLTTVNCRFDAHPPFFETFAELFKVIFWTSGGHSQSLPLLYHCCSWQNAGYFFK